VSERFVHWALLALALAGLIAGAAAYFYDRPDLAGQVWSAATLPVVVGLAVSIVRDFLMGRVGVDAIALFSMSVALLLGEPLAGIVVAIMYSGGNALEDFARGRAERELRALTDRTPRVAHRHEDSRLVDVPVEAVRIGDELLVRAGELLPVDGVLVETYCIVDESAVTGEPIPERRISGDVLRSGTVNAGEAFHYRASRTADDSTYAGIVRMVQAAQTAKAPFIRMADRFALVLLPAVLIVAAAAWLISGDPVRGLAVLVVATPCPLILAAPVAFIGGVSRAARLGVLMKGSAALEAMAQVRTAIFDKTGTLTEGGAQLLTLDTAPGVDAMEALRLVASLEQASHHVVAEALVVAGRRAGLTLSRPEDIREHRGSGVEGRVDGRDIRAGARSLVVGDAPLPSWAAAIGDGGNDHAALRVFVAVDGALAAVLSLGDGIRPDAAEAIAGLREAGVGRIVMVTGDDAETARAIAARLDIDEILADQSPAEKVAAVAAEKARGPVLMVGDGINDAPALAAATVGVAMGARGATASSEAADIVVLADRLALVADAVEVARRSRAIAMQSIVAGLALSGVGMIAAAFGYLPPVAGALAQEAIDVAVIVNALRALGSGHAPRGGTDFAAAEERAAIREEPV
jgi:heavy metal translocating P-type ATPase